MGLKFPSRELQARKLPECGISGLLARRCALLGAMDLGLGIWGAIDVVELTPATRRGAGDHAHVSWPRPV